MELLVAAAIYLAALGVFYAEKRKELANSPEKMRRYDVLPWQHKLACWAGVLPMITALPTALLLKFDAPFLAVLSCVVGAIAFTCLEIACVSHYRKHGLWN